MKRPLASITVLLLLALAGCGWGETTGANNPPSGPQQIGNGTTEAGYDVEQQIATALTNAVRDAL